MITLDKEKRTIEFADKWEPNKQKIHPTRVLPLISGFLCPWCNRIIRAYFDARGEAFKILPYEEYRTAEYNREFAEFWTPCNSGAGITTKQHSRWQHKCDAEIYTPFKLELSMKQFATRHNMPYEDWWVDAVRIVETPGLKLAHDICGKDDPLVTFNEEEAMGGPRRLGETWEFWENRCFRWQEKWANDFRDRAIMAGVKIVKVELPPDEE